jgi:hypothetical protein
VRADLDGKARAVLAPRLALENKTTALTQQRLGPLQIGGRVWRADVAQADADELLARVPVDLDGALVYVDQAQVAVE